MSDSWPLGVMRRRSGRPPGPGAIVRPVSYQAVAELLREAGRNGTVVVPLGGLSAVTGAVDLLPGQVGLDLGALNQVLEIDEHNLVARVQAAVRRGVRAQDAPRGDAIEIEELRIDPREVQAFVAGSSAALTPTEFKLLYTLALEEGRVVTRDELLQRIWGRRQTHRDRTVDVFVRRLRDKIDKRAPRHTFIQTRYGVGYKLDAVAK